MPLSRELTFSMRPTHINQRRFLRGAFLFLCLLSGLFQLSCSGISEHYVADDKRESLFDLFNERGQIEEWILALPEKEIHGESWVSFERRVRNARRLPQNRGKTGDYLSLEGDGVVPAGVVELNRQSRVLFVTIGSEGEAQEKRQYWRQKEGWLVRGR